MREYAAVKPVPVKIGDREYGILFSFGKLKRIREQLKIDLLGGQQEVDPGIFSKILFEGLINPDGMTVDQMEDAIFPQQLPYYMERLRAAITGQVQPSEETKNDSSASMRATGSANPKARKKQNSGSGVQPLVNGASETETSGA